MISTVTVTVDIAITECAKVLDYTQVGTAILIPANGISTKNTDLGNIFTGKHGKDIEVNGLMTNIAGKELTIGVLEKSCWDLEK